MILSFWVQLAALAGTYLWEKYMTPHPKIEPEKPTQPDIPITGAGTPVALIYGKTIVRRPAVIWWGDTYSEPVNAAADDGVVTLGYRQQYGIAIGLGLGVANSNLRKIWFGDYGVFNGNMVTGGTLESDGGYSHPGYTGYNVFGGTYKGGVASGHWRYYPGNFTQLESEYQAWQTGYRGYQYVIFYSGSAAVPSAGFAWGYQATPPPLSFEVDGYPDALAGGSYRTIDDDANPAEVIYDILTNPWGRLGIDTARVDSTSFSAAAVTLHGELYSGVSFCIDEHVSAKDVIDEILRHIDAVIYEEITTDQIAIKLIRNDYSVGSIPSFDDDNTVEVLEYTPGTWNETYNSVDIIYEDRDSAYKKQAATLHNISNFYGAGQERIRSAELEFPFCRHRTAASKLAVRELKALSTPRKRVRLVVNRDAFDLRPGDVFKWSNTEYGVTDVVLRIMQYSIGTSTESSIVLDCVEDIYAIDPAVWNLPPTTIYELPDPAEVTVKRSIEMPQWIGYRAELRGRISNRDDSRIYYLAQQPDQYQLGFHPNVSVDAGTTYAIDGAALGADRYPFTEVADVETAYPRTLDPYDTATGLRIDTVSNASALLSASAANIRSRGHNLILVVEADGTHEWMAYESFTDLGGGTYRLNNVWRGLLDTAPIDHAVNAKVWFGPDLGLGYALVGNTGRDGDEACKIRLKTVTGYFELNDEALTPEDLTLVGRSKLPYPVADMEVDAALPWDAASPVKEYPGVAIAGESNNWVVGPEIITSWAERLRTSETIRRGDDASETNEDNVTYEIGADEGGGYEEIGPGETGTSAVNNLQLLGSGAGSVRVRTKRADVDGDSYGFTAPEIAAQFAEFRQLLVNPSFDDATDGRGWTSVSVGINPVFTEDSNAFGFTGKFMTNLDLSGVLQVEQVVDVAALSPSGKDARLTFKCRDLNTASLWSVQVQMISENGAGTDLDTADSGQLTPNTSYWDSHELTISGLNASTTQIRIIVYLRYQTIGSHGTNLRGAIDDMDLRLCSNITAQQLLNPGMDAATTSWTTSNMSVVTTNRTEGAGWARGNAASATCQMYQEINPVPATYGTGDIVMLKCIRYQEAADDTGEVLLEAVDSGGSTLLSVSTGAEGDLDDGTWHHRELYLKIPASTAKLRVTFNGVRVTGSDLETGWDDVRLWLFDVTP